MSAAPSGRATWPALLALPAVALAAAAQWALEGARHAEPLAPLPHGAWLFVPAVLLAVVALARRDDPGALGAGRLSITPVSWRWFAACLPGAACFAAAFVLHLRREYFPGHPTTARLWLLGIALVLAPGAVHAIVHRKEILARRFDDVPRWLLALLVLALVAVALGLRTWGGLERIPAWVENDEASTGLGGRVAFGEKPWTVFSFWMGMPQMAVAVVWVLLKLFGADLHGLRLGFAVLGTLSILFFFDAARRLVGTGTAFAAALLVAVNHTYVHWSRQGQAYVETPFFGMLVLALFVRAWTGGGFLPLVGAAVALGIGAPTYPPSHLLPIVLLVTGIGWAVFERLPLRRAAATLLLVEGLAFLMYAPVLRTVWVLRQEEGMRRMNDISILQPKNFASLSHSYGLEGRPAADVLLTHARKTMAVFNFSRDAFPGYGADRAMTDPVVAALVPLAFGLLLFRFGRPAAFFVLVSTGAYLAAGVFLAGHPPTYHRIAIAIFGASLAVAWAVREMAGGVAAALRLPAATSLVAALAVAAASGVASARYYFHEFPPVTHLENKTAMGWLVCSYAGKRAVIDATTLDGREYVPLHNVLPTFQCPALDRVWCKSLADLWNVAKFTKAERAVLIVPEQVVNETPGTPAGYRVVRTYVDRSIEYPGPVPLRVYELERANPGPDSAAVAPPAPGPLH